MKHKYLLRKKLQFIQIKKTSSLIIASLKIGDILAGADYHSIKALEVYGLYTGILFQTIDDIIDIYSKKQVLGKIGSNLYNKKLTVLSLYNKQEIDNNINKYMIKAKKEYHILVKKQYFFYTNNRIYKK
jgi:geranylgeranyl diphosphate synthase type II